MQRNVNVALRRKNYVTNLSRRTPTSRTPTTAYHHHHHITTRLKHQNSLLPITYIIRR